MTKDKPREITTIQLTPATRELIKKKKRGAETYDDVIRRMVR